MPSSRRLVTGTAREAAAAAFAVDIALPPAAGVDQPNAARSAERSGYAGLWAGEVTHDPFLLLGLAATVTERISLGTSVALALARSPMTLATSAHGLQALSGGRFRLGPGSQVKAHVTRRFSMPWSRPAARMRAFYASTPAYRPVLAVHGWEALGDEPHRLSRLGRWTELPGLVDDAVMDAFAVTGEPAGVAAELRRPYGGLFTRCVPHAGYGPGPGVLEEIAERVRGEPPAAGAGS